jgi:hypothetical protein
MKQTVKLILITTILSIVCDNGYSQKSYRTTNGHVLINGVYEDSVFTAKSHKLILEYDAGNKTINGNLNLQTFSSDVLYIDSIISQKPIYINIAGSIPVDFISWNHSDYNLDIPLEIKFNKIVIVVPAEIKLSHAENLPPHTCIMSVNFNVKLSDFMINIPKQLNETINVQFLQLILRQKYK